MKLILILILFFITENSFSQDYFDSIRELRVLHFAELTDTSKGILNQDEIDHFEGLDYFLIDTNYIIKATFIKNKGRKFKMPTSTDRTPVYRRYGYVKFKIDTIEHQLTVYQNIKLKKQKEYRDYLFLPFRDASSGNESYGGGRYLDLRIPNSDKIKLDFNICYNPYCAYSIRYSCPIPPKENTLPCRIPAGEKTPKGH